MTQTLGAPPVPHPPAAEPEGVPHVPGVHRSRGDARPRWQVVVAVVAFLTVLPIALVVGSLLNPEPRLWRYLLELGLTQMVLTTVALLVLVVAGSTVIGAGLAWLVARYSFPGRRLFSWLLVLPLAIPAYVLGFVYLALLDHPGPVQTALRAGFGPDVWFPEVRALWLAAFVFILALYPYPYILARAALAEQSATTFEAARALGAGPVRTAVRVVLPLARPSLAAGALVVAMETLTDFATVSYFNVTTVSVGIHQVWVGQYDRQSASQLAGVVLLFAFAVIVAERLARGGQRFHQQGGGGRRLEPVRLHGGRAAGATAICLLVLGVGFVVPVWRLALWSRPGDVQVGLDARFAGYVVNSALVAGLVALLCVSVGLLLASASRLGGGRATPWLARLASLGYAVPGPVVAIGVMLILSGLDAVVASLRIPLGVSLVTGTLAGLLYAYTVRFLALAWSSLDASLDKVSPSLTAAALSLGDRPVRVVRRVHLPLLRSGIGVALVLVAVDALKELPIMLLLRPFGFETLAVWVYQLSAESRWFSVGPPALTIVVVALIPILLVFRRTLAVPEVRE